MSESQQVPLLADSWAQQGSEQWWYFEENLEDFIRNMRLGGRTHRKNTQLGWSEPSLSFWRIFKWQQKLSPCQSQKFKLLANRPGVDPEVMKLLGQKFYFADRYEEVSLLDEFYDPMAEIKEAAALNDLGRIIEVQKIDASHTGWQIAGVAIFMVVLAVLMNKFGSSPSDSPIEESPPPTSPPARGRAVGGRAGRSGGRSAAFGISVTSS